MYVKIEPSGCCERKGMVQIRFCMYLDAKDYGYELHHVQASVIPEGGYPGKVGDMGMPINQKDYDKWLDSLPKVWQNNPFHNHFIYVEPEMTDKEIMDIAEAFLHEAYIKWAQDLSLISAEHQLRNDALSFKKKSTASECEARLKAIKKITAERRI